MRLGAELPGSSAAAIVAMSKRLNVSSIGFDIDAALDLAAAQAAFAPFKQAGLTIIQLGCYRNLISVDSAVRMAAVDDVVSAMNVAGALGIETVVCGGGHRDPSMPTARRSVHPDNWTDQALDVIIDSCREIVARVEAGAAPLCLEPWVITCLNTPQRIERVVRAVNHPKLGVELDLANLVTIEWYFRTADLIADCFDRFGDSIHIVHLKDVRLTPEPYIYHLGEVVVGDGGIDFDALLRIMDSRRPGASLMVEHLHEEADLKRALDHMRSVAAARGLSLN